MIIDNLALLASLFCKGSSHKIKRNYSNHNPLECVPVQCCVIKVSSLMKVMSRKRKGLKSVSCSQRWNNETKHRLKGNIT